MTRTALLALTTGLVLIAPAGAGDTAKEVRKALDALNEAFAKGDAKALKGLMTADHVAVTPSYGGPQTRDEQLKGLADLELKEYKAAKMTVRLLGKDAALVRYELAQRGTYKGKPVPPRSYASAVWVRQGGRWREAFYQETALPTR